MPFSFDPDIVCKTCPYGGCIEDRRNNPVRGRTTLFRLRQNTALSCTFSYFVPGTDNDSEPSRTFDDYLSQFRKNALLAGKAIFDASFNLDKAALAKVEGDVFELIDIAAMWNAAATWNVYMDTGAWTSEVFSIPPNSVPTPRRKVAIVKLPRGYDATKLFKTNVRNSILAHESALQLRGMELGLSAPDLVGIRIPDAAPAGYTPFLTPLPNLSDQSRALIENAYSSIEGTVEARSFLFAIAVKRTTRSDRLYQPLFEANVLKYLIEVVLGGAAFRFNVHLGSFEGSDVRGHYKAASLISLVRGGAPSLAVDRLLLAQKPREMAQETLNDFPMFPL
ncbi:MAG: hypothetical protein AMXMBFR67_15280 [Nitrospira sp.]